MKLPLAITLFAALPVLAAPPVVPAEKLLAEIIESPGSFNQMCMMPRRIDPTLPMIVYGTTMPRHFNVSEKNLERLRQRRAEVIPALAKTIASIRPGEPGADPLQPKPDVTKKTFEELITHSGISPKQVSGLLFEIVVGLKAHDLLPELLALEERMESALARAEQDDTAPLPPVDNDGALFFDGPAEALTPRAQALLRGRIVQRELLATMLDLLRERRFRPLLDSEFEQVYAAALKKRAAEDDLRGIKTPKDAAKKGLEDVRFDPIYGVPAGHLRTPPSVPYTPEVRQKARALVAAYLKK